LYCGKSLQAANIRRTARETTNVRVHILSKMWREVERVITTHAYSPAQEKMGRSGVIFVVCAERMCLVLQWPLVFSMCSCSGTGSINIYAYMHMHVHLCVCVCVH